MQRSGNSLVKAAGYGLASNWTPEQINNCGKYNTLGMMVYFHITADSWVSSVRGTDYCTVRLDVNGRNGSWERNNIEVKPPIDFDENGTKYEEILSGLKSCGFAITNTNGFEIHKTKHIWFRAD